MYTLDDILDSLINGQMKQVRNQFLDSDVSLIDLYYHAQNVTNDEILSKKVLYMADDLIDRS